MLARTHALSAAAGWTCTAAALTAAGAPLPWPYTLGGAIVCAGAALAPDIDHPDSHAARSLGPLTRTAARGVAAASRAIYARTATPADPPDTRRQGHRGVTHTFAFALAAGALVAGLAFTPAGPVVAGVVLFLTATWAARGLLTWRGRHVRVGPRWARVRVEWAPFAGALAAAALLYFAPDGAAWAWLGLPVTLGCVLHDLGDAPAHRAGSPPEWSGVPLLWPLKIHGQRWYRVRPPARLMFPVGGPLEVGYAVVFGLAAVAGAGALIYTAAG